VLPTRPTCYRYVVMLDVELFTDPACPFAFSAEPVRQRLRWHYGDGLRITVRMIVLTREPGEADKLAEGAAGLQQRFGMPIDPRPYPRAASSEPACLAVVAARLHAPERADALLRRLRIAVMQLGLLDDPAVIAGAAAEAGIDPAALDTWCAAPETAAALNRDAAAARSPLPAARALEEKLGGPRGEPRYSAPSYVINGVAIPGLNPIEVYETVVANADPQLPRRPKPSSVYDVLKWADEPLATAEVALLMQTTIDEAREDLSRLAVFEPAGADGYWSL
jgi:predicted DsbA family dithiol-disulfide isomerase